MCKDVFTSVKNFLPAWTTCPNGGRDAYMNTVDNIIPGMRGCDVFKLAEKETYRQDWNQFVPIEFVGHGIGTLNHEPPLAGRGRPDRDKARHDPLRGSGLL